MQKDAYERTRIERISESDFWSAWSQRADGLRLAAAHGRDGEKERAYQMLAILQRHELAKELAQARDQAKQRNADPATRTKTFEQADDVRKGRIRGWHDQTIEFGQRIDFNANFGQSGQYGFHYLFWLVPLLDRYLLTGNKDDLARLVDIARQYYDQRLAIKRRIAELHPVYYELGAYAKTANLLPIYAALVCHSSPQAADVEAFMKLFLGFGRSLCRLQRPRPAAKKQNGAQRGYRAGNWQIVGCQALLRLGSVFGQLREAPKWRKTALTMLEAHLKHDFFADGGHKERCWSYGWMSLKGVIDAYEAGRRAGTLPATTRAKFLKTIRRGCRWFQQTLTPTDICPAYGDGDLSDAKDILETARKYLPPRCAAVNHEAKSVFLRPSGYAIMRDDGSRDARYLNVNFGPTGGGHTNLDLLDFNVWAFGQPLLEEVGRFSSYDHPLNAMFRSPEAHNQVVIDHQVMQRHLAQGRNVVWTSTPECDYLGAWHDAFREGDSVARVHRHILFKRRAWWLIYDVIEPLSETILSVSSWLHAVRPFQVLGPGRARIQGSPSCLVCFAQPHELKRFERGADVCGAEVTVERLYPDRFSLRARTWAQIGYRGCLRFTMLIYPFPQAVPEVDVRPVEAPGQAPGGKESFEVRCPSGVDRVVFDRSKRQRLCLGR